MADTYSPTDIGITPLDRRMMIGAGLLLIFTCIAAAVALPSQPSSMMLQATGTILPSTGAMQID